MTYRINGHSVEFTANGRIFVDDRVIGLAIRSGRGQHTTFISPGAPDADTYQHLADRVLTGPRRPIGTFEADLASEIIAAITKI